MKPLETMTTYFQGEKTEALVFILPVGLLSLVFGGWLVSENQGGFARGVAIPFLLMGLFREVNRAWPVCLVAWAVFGIAEPRARPYTAALETSASSSPTPEPLH